MKRLRYLDDVNAEPAGQYDTGRIIDTMETFAEEPGGLLRLVERYGDSENVDIANSLCFTLARTADTHSAETANAVMLLLGKLRCREWGPPTNLLSAINRLLVHDAFYPRGEPPPPALYPFLIDCLDDSAPSRDMVIIEACDVIGALSAGVELLYFPPDQVAELRRRLRALVLTEGDVGLRLSLISGSEFLAGGSVGTLTFPLDDRTGSPAEQRECVAQVLADLDYLAAHPPATPDPVRVFERMEVVAFSPGGLPLLVERYGAVDVPQLLVPLGLMLHAAARGHRFAIAPLAIQVLERSHTRDEATVEILEWTLWDVMKYTRHRWFSNESPAPPEEAPPLQDYLPLIAYCLGRGPDLRGGAMLTLGILHEEGQMSRFPPEQVADIRRRLQELSRDPDEQLQKDLKDVAEFLVEPA